MLRAVLLVSCLLLGCEPKLVVGERNDGGAGGTGGTAGGGGTAGQVGDAGDAGDAGVTGQAGAAEAGAAGEAGATGMECPNNGNRPAQKDPIAIPWSTGFENGFCDFDDAGGFCIGTEMSGTVSSPARSGQAAEFNVRTDNTTDFQARCVRQGVLPSAAYYGAWFYIPMAATLGATMSGWNLMHFQGGDASKDGLWDVSLVNGTNGELELLIFDFLHGVVRKPAQSVAFPTGDWVHIQFYLKRASDATGAIQLYQGTTLLVDVKNLVTDDSTWGQWYVGNYGRNLTPPDITLYVDDVTIAATRN